MSDAPARGLSQPTKILLGLVLGAVIGSTANLMFAPARGEPADATYQRIVWFADWVAKPAGDIFLRLLFMVVVPLVFSSLVLGVLGIGDLGKLGRTGARTLFWFLGTTTLAVALGLVMVNVFQPGAHISPEKAQEVMQMFAGDAKERVAQGQAGTGFSIYTFVNIIPRNVIASAGNEREALGLIFFAMLFGIAATQVAVERTKVLRDLLEVVYDVCVRLLGYAMKLAPIGVFGLIFATTAKLGFEIMESLLYYIAVALAGLVIHQFVVLTGLAWFCCGVSPGRLLRGTRGLMTTAFSTSSSNATLPTTMRTAIEEFGVPKHIAGFVMPLGATMNMNGTALFEGVTVLFLAQVTPGVDLSLGQQIVVVVMSVMTAIGAAGVPGGSLPLLTLVLAQVNVPPESIALILGTDRLVDMARTVPNVTSDLICSMWVGKGRNGAPAP